MEQLNMTSPETDLKKLLASLEPTLNPGQYVFCTVRQIPPIDPAQMVMSFKEVEGTTIVLEKRTADQLNLSYTYIAAWITLCVHSSLQAVGLTAAFSNALSKHGISCNVVAAYHHDHIFVDQHDAETALTVLRNLSLQSKD